jgi:glycosyltransferase involved in cell wall biosynthesis
VRRRRGMLYVGTIEPRKYVALVVAAARRLHESGHRIPLTIVGKPGWGDYDLQRDIATLPDVRYRGFVDDATLRRLYREAATFVYPSTVEGFGLPVVEAMGYGALPIVSADPALCEAVGDADLVLPKTTPQALADAVLRWHCPSPERTRKRRALARRASTFTWDRAAAAVLDIYDELA